MSNKSCGSADEDLEAQDSPLTAADKPSRRWRRILLMLQAHRIFISILGYPRRSLAPVEISSASSYAGLSTSDGADHEVCFSFQ